MPAEDRKVVLKDGSAYQIGDLDLGQFVRLKNLIVRLFRKYRQEYGGEFQAAAPLDILANILGVADETDVVELLSIATKCDDRQFLRENFTIAAFLQSVSWLFQLNLADAIPEDLVKAQGSPGP